MSRRYFDDGELMTMNKKNNKLSLVQVSSLYQKAVHTKMLTVAALILACLTFNASALEVNVEAHKVLDAGTYGYSLGVTDNFFKQRAINWKVSYNTLDNVNVNWNNKDYDMSLDTVDLALTYRYFPRSYNKVIKNLTFEVQAGASVSLTEGRLIFPVEEALDDEILSEKGDVNAVLSFLTYYKISKSTSVHVGVKYYPSYSEYGDVSSLFLGFDYHFGRQTAY